MRKLIQWLASKATNLTKPDQRGRLVLATLWVYDEEMSALRFVHPTLSDDEIRALLEYVMHRDGVQYITQCRSMERSDRERRSA